MKFGAFSFNTDYGMRADVLAQALETRGYESLWVGEHTHIPAERHSPYPGGGELPCPYYHIVDPFVSLMAAAGATQHLKIATGICLVVERDPITLAKEVASLDLLSGGRFLLGIGGGWNAEEMENHGTPFARRWKILRENVEAMKAIWAQEEASYEGEFVRFDRIISYPKPAQTPHPPIIYGGGTEQGVRRVVRYCDGWLPFDVMGNEFDRLVGVMHDEARAADRDPSGIEISMFSFRTPDAATIEHYMSLGVERVVLVLPRQEDATMGYLDDCVGLLEQFAA